METKIASLWRRVGGALVDLIIVFLMSGAILFVWGFFIGFNGTEKYLTADESSMLWKGRGMLVGLIVDGILTTALMAGEKQATFGQQAVGIKTIKDDGTKLGYDTAIGRWVVSLFSSIILKIGFAIAIFTEKQKTLHDLLAGTVVVTNVKSTNEMYQTPISNTHDYGNINPKDNTFSTNNDEHIYEQVYEELYSEKRKNGLFIKIITNNNGNKEQAEIEYIKVRVSQLKSENEELLQTKKKIKFKLNSKPINEELLKAVKNTDSNLASQLLKSGISHDGSDDEGYTLMEIAISNKDKTMQQLLKAYGAKN
jgi:uncharacterized RDD family membrane protein YckC